MTVFFHDWLATLIMKHKEHRLGVTEINLVNRHLALLEPINSEHLSAAIGEIDKLFGMDEVSFDEKHTRLDISYDASRLCIQCVEDILAKNNIQPRQDRWTRFKVDHYCFVDQNIKDNMRHAT